MRSPSSFKSKSPKKWLSSSSRKQPLAYTSIADEDEEDNEDLPVAIELLKQIKSGKKPYADDNEMVHHDCTTGRRAVSNHDGAVTVPFSGLKYWLNRKRKDTKNDNVVEKKEDSNVEGMIISYVKVQESDPVKTVRGRTKDRDGATAPECTDVTLIEPQWTPPSPSCHVDIMTPIVAPLEGVSDAIERTMDYSLSYDITDSFASCDPWSSSNIFNQEEDDMSPIKARRFEWSDDSQTQPCSPQMKSVQDYIARFDCENTILV